MSKFDQYQPLEDRIIIKPDAVTELEKTDSGIIIPDSAKKEVREGTVISVGPGRYASETGTFIPTCLGKDDRILYGINQGMEISIQTESGRQDVRIMREGDVLLLISKKEQSS